MNKQKFKTDKILHEVIRDLPAAQRTERLLDRGHITIEEALENIAQTIREEKARANR